MTVQNIMTDTNQQYNQAIASCKQIFMQKTVDYGTSWRVLRPISIVDQIFIKAQRIRTIQQKLEEIAVEDLPATEVSNIFDEKATLVKRVMEDKNHDYGEAWRDMSQE